jgi:3-deoxy-D-manno-octulosonic-acid transferase
VPYDLPDMVQRFLRRVQPRILIVMETELWPNLFSACYRNHIPVVLANARLSEKSAIGYHRIAPLMPEIFQSIRCLLAHAASDEGRFRALGMPLARMQVTGSLKYDLELAPELATMGALLRRSLGESRPIWLAASTHPGEETIMLAAHTEVRRRFPDALLILLPRHPERFDDVAANIAAAGFSWVRRSEKMLCSPEKKAVYLADSFGEMMLMYAACDVACVAGSFVPVGGHNMIEPAALKKPVVTGPELFNFSEISAAMLEAGGMVTVTDALKLAEVVIHWFGDPVAARRVGEQGFSVVEQNRGALKKQLAAVCRVLENGTVKYTV